MKKLRIHNEQLTVSFKVFESSQPYGNAVLNKSFDFSVRIVKLFQHLKRRDSSIESLLKQVLRSGTSIGANITEAQGASSKKDFINKLQISLKEARETEYWLRLLNATGYLKQNEFEGIDPDCKEIIKLLVAILKKSKNNS